MIYKKSRMAGCVISLKAYKLLIERLGKFGKSGTALDIWEEMQECGFQPGREIYEFIVNGLCNVGKVDCLGRVTYRLNNKLLDMDKVEITYNLFKKVKDACAIKKVYCKCALQRG